MEPEVLLIDEVLSVGDFFFQQLAYERLSTLARDGNPVVLVTHQLNGAADLCNRVLLLRGGAIARHGTPAECIAEYIGSGASAHSASSDIWITEVATDPADEVASGNWLSFAVKIEFPNGPIAYPYALGLTVRSIGTGQEIYWTSSDRFQFSGLLKDRSFWLSGSLQMNVPPGLYSLETWIYDRKHSARSATGQIKLLTIPGVKDFHGEGRAAPLIDGGGDVEAFIALQADHLRPSAADRTFAISVLPTPASPSRNSGRPIRSAR